MKLPDGIEVRAFDELHDRPERWRAAVASIAAAHSTATVQANLGGTVLVGMVGNELVVKLYPPFLRDHHAFERVMLECLHGSLGVPTPRLVDAGERDGWPWLVMTQLAGEPLTRAWPSMTEAQRCSVLAQIGAVAAEVHALAPDPVLPLAPDWDVFVARQRAGCRQRQERTGLPAQLLARLEAFVGGELPAGRPVMLTGEYTPMNLLSSGGRLAAMFDFGDGLVGPGAYDWLGPLCFLAAGSAPRCRAFFDGYGASPEPGWQQGALRLLLLHRYSHLKAQLALPGWERAPSFEALAHALWPVG